MLSRLWRSTAAPRSAPWVLAVHVLGTAACPPTLEPCKEDVDCSRTERCELGVCVRAPELAVPDDDVPDEGLGEGEGEGFEGEGEGIGPEPGEGEGEPEPEPPPPRLASLAFHDPYGLAVTTLVWTEATQLVVRGFTEASLELIDLVCSPGTQLDLQDPTAADLDTTATVTCHTPAYPEAPLTASVTILPVAAAPREDVDAFALGTTVDPMVLVETTPETTCVFAQGQPPERNGTYALSCARAGATISDVDVPVRWLPAIELARCGLSANGALVVEVDQRAADECSVTCDYFFRLEVQANGRVNLPLAPGARDTECTVACSNEVAAAEPYRFLMMVGDITSKEQLTAAADAVVLAGSMRLTEADLDDEGQSVTGSPNLQVVTGHFEITDTGNGEVKLSFPELRVLAADLKLLDSVGLVGLDANEASERPEAFPSLERIDGDLRVSANPNLTAASFPALARVAGKLVVFDNAQLSFLRLPVLRSLGPEDDEPELTIAANNPNVACEDEISSLYCALETAPTHLLTEGTTPCFLGEAPECP